jgi:adenylate cyclase
MKVWLGRLMQRLRSGTGIHIVLRALFGVAIVLVAFAYKGGWVPAFPPLEQLELISYDMRLRAFMPKTIDKNVAIIDIDERSLQEQGRFPWPRDKLATLTKNLFDTYQVKVVGFDIVFAEEDTSSGLKTLESLAEGQLKETPAFVSFVESIRPQLDYDGLFAAALKDRNVVMGFAIGTTGREIGVLPAPTFSADVVRNITQPDYIASANGYSANIGRLMQAAPLAGHLYPVVDDDGLIRRVPMFARIGNNLYDSLSLATLRLALDNPPTTLLRTQDDTPVLTLGNVVLPLDINLAAYVPFRGPKGFIPYISATDVINKKADPSTLKDKVVLVGTSALGLLDLRATPVQVDLPGVEVHASLIAGALDNRIMSRTVLEFGATGLIILVVGLGLALAMPMIGPNLATASTLVAVGALATFNIYMWRHGQIYEMALPIVLVLVIYFFNMAYGFFTESRSKRLITARFGEYIPRELVEEMAANPEQASMAGETREMTVLFSDVRGFTTISESLSATELSGLMNAYLTPMTEIVQQHRGTIDKYIGDAIMCFWGAPLKDIDHATHGVVAALAMQARLKTLGDEFEARGWPRLEIGVGLNSGDMRVGNMGSEFRRAYTVMGDAVNLGSRLEAATKDYGVGILVSETVVQKAPNFVYRELDRIRVKGKLEPVTIYEPIGKGGEVPADVLDRVDLFHRALDRYRAQRWDDAELLLMRLAKVDPNLKLLKEYRERIARHRINPPGPNWDGVENRTTK